MDNLPSQLLSSALIALTTFIPNDSLRYIALGSTLLSLVGYAVFVNNLSSQAAQCEISMPEIEALFTTRPALHNRGWIAVDIGETVAVGTSHKNVAGPVALESARQQAYIEDINQKRRTLEVAFGGDRIVIDKYLVWFGAKRNRRIDRELPDTVNRVAHIPESYEIFSEAIFSLQVRTVFSARHRQPELLTITLRTVLVEGDA
ncbi:hypothetical protein C8J57DRAFT_1211544 [Mycena rebaudengoi]|nr:hypothetical protein C8J57DRAFT_1211544 [Mycena rebaudengoi]